MNVNETQKRQIRITTKLPNELDKDGWKFTYSEYRQAVQHIAEACRSGLVVTEVQTNN